MTPPAARLLAACGTLAPVVFTAAWVVAGFVQDGYSARREDISALAARTAEHPWLMTAGLDMTGLLVAAFALGLHRGVRRGSVTGPALVVLCGLGIVALGLPPQRLLEPDRGVRSPCRGRRGLLAAHGA